MAVLPARALAVALMAAACPSSPPAAPPAADSTGRTSAPTSTSREPGTTAPESAGAPSGNPNGGVPGRSARTGATSAPPTMTSAQPFVRLYSAQNSGYRLGNETAIRDQAGWTAAWSTIHGGTPGEPAPSVDFTRDMVLLIALGERNSGGYTVRVDGVTPAGRGAVVRYTITEPGEGCMTTQALTAPVVAVRAPRVAGEVRFEPRTVRERC